MSVIINGTSGISTDGGSELFGSGSIGGSLTLTSGTANGVAYLNGSKVLTSGSALTFDGSNLSTTGQVLLENNNYIGFKNTTGTYAASIFNDTSNYLNLYNSGNTGTIFYVNAAEQMRLTSTGLGIGTSSPSATLDVRASGVVSQYLISASGSNQQNQIVSLYNSGAGYGSLNIDGLDLRFRISNSEHMRIDSAGNVGIGTSSPTQQLTIEGAMNLRNGSRAGAFEIDSSGNLWVGTATTAGNIIFESGHTTAGLPSTGGERARIDSSGHLIVPAGITLGTAAGTYAAANTLDDYEEGTWTGLIAGSTTAGTFTNLINSCSYTKIGRQVTVQYYVQWESGTGTGNLILTGLPFTSRNESGFYYAGTLSYANVLRTANATPAPNIYHNATQIEFLQIPTTDGDSTNIAYDAAGRLMGMHTYFTA
jgi:hypothetical protein